jgi:hypothetical protein
LQKTGRGHGSPCPQGTTAPSGASTARAARPWADSAPLTPDAALAVGDHTVLLAGPGSQGFEKALYAVDTRDHTHTLLLRLPNTTQITGFAHGSDETVYLLTDIRGNEEAPRPHLLRLELPAAMRR